MLCVGSSMGVLARRVVPGGHYQAPSTLAPFKELSVALGDSFHTLGSNVWKEEAVPTQ